VALLGLTAWQVTRSEALAEAKRADRLGDVVRCLERALDHLAYQPWSREAARLAARSLSRLDHAEAAEAYYQKAGLETLSLDDLQARAYGLARGPSPEQAIPAYQELLARFPDDVTALRRLGAVELALNHREAILSVADRLTRTPGGEAVGFTLRGVVYHNERSIPQAIEAFERVVELDPGLRTMPLPRHTFWTYLFDDLVEANRLDDAARYASQELAIAPNAELMNRLGRLYLIKGDANEAERWFLQASALDPEAAEPRASLGRVALGRKRYDEAVGHFEQAAELDPGKIDILVRLEQAYRLNGQEAEAARTRDRIQQRRALGASERRRAQDGTKPAPTTSSGGKTWPAYAL
jgi:tetratricopeptide (TPR) repeat protein